MAATDDYNTDDYLYSDDDPLVQRLRRLEWARVPDGVRERCWEEFKRRLDERIADGALPPLRDATVTPATGTERRHLFSRCSQPPRRLLVHSLHRPGL